MNVDSVNKEISEVLNDQQRASWRENFEQLRGDWIPSPPPAPQDRTVGE